MMPVLRGRQIGLILVIISAVLFFITLSFMFQVQQLNRELHKGCNLPIDVCPMYTTVPWQSVLGFTFDSILLIFGVFLMLQKEGKGFSLNKKIEGVMNSLEPEEKNICDSLLKANGVMFQSELIEGSGFSKVKITRILDRLEARGLVERRRRGMSNIVMLKP